MPHIFISHEKDILINHIAWLSVELVNVSERKIIRAKIAVFVEYNHAKLFDFLPSRLWEGISHYTQTSNNCNSSSEGLKGQNRGAFDSALPTLPKAYG
jgi:hypothetical protein